MTRTIALTLIFEILSLAGGFRIAGGETSIVAGVSERIEKSLPELASPRFSRREAATEAIAQALAELEKDENAQALRIALLPLDTRCKEASNAEEKSRLGELLAPYRWGNPVWLVRKGVERIAASGDRVVTWEMNDPPAYHLECFDLRTGKRQWQVAPVWAWLMELEFDADRVLAWGDDMKNQYLLTIDAATGQTLLKEHALPPEAEKALDINAPENRRVRNIAKIRASALDHPATFHLRARRAYAVDWKLGQQGVLQCLDADSGKLLWEAKLLSNARPLLASDSDRLFAISGGKLICRDAKTGALLWEQAPAEGSAPYGRMIPHGGMLLVNRGDGRLPGSLDCLEGGSGKLLWSSVKLPGPVTSAEQVPGGICLGGPGGIGVYDPRTGATVWQRGRETFPGPRDRPIQSARLMGGKLWAAGVDGQGRCWLQACDSATGKVLEDRAEPVQGAVQQVFLHQGRLLACGGGWFGCFRLEKLID